MIAFRDFPVDRRFWVSRRRWDAAFEAACIAANEWIGRESIEVINIETLGNTDTSIVPRSLRVWHRTPSSKPRSFPEV